jgi:membrane protein DedA with SNARE-associated domain
MLHDATVWVRNLIEHLGYAGIFGGMTLQATGFVPLPSEVIMSFGGYLASTGSLILWIVIAAGALGDTTGAIIAYAIGYYGGRPLLERFGRFVFVRHSDLQRAERWFDRFGSRAVFICRLLPGIRAIGSLPAGIARMHVAVFLGYTFAGAAVWCAAFSTLGFTLGNNWVALEPYVRKFSLVLLAVVVLAIGFWIWSHFRAEKQAAKA